MAKTAAEGAELVTWMADQTKKAKKGKKTTKGKKGKGGKKK